AWDRGISSPPAPPPDRESPARLPGQTRHTPPVPLRVPDRCPSDLLFSKDQLRAYTKPCAAWMQNGRRRLLADLDGGVGGHEVEELDDVPVAHAHAADRAGLAHFGA